MTQFSPETETFLTTVERSKNYDGFVDCFTGIANFVRAKNEDDVVLTKRGLGVIVSTDSLQEATNFAKAYTAALKEADLIRTGNLVEVSWKDLCPRSKNHIKAFDEISKKFKEAFKKAAGGVILIRDAYEGKDAETNFSVSGELCARFDEADFDEEECRLIEDPNKPVVILTGKTAVLEKAYTPEKDQVPMDMRFLVKIGLKGQGL